LELAAELRGLALAAEPVQQARPELPERTPLVRERLEPRLQTESASALWPVRASALPPVRPSKLTLPAPGRLVRASALPPARPSRPAMLVPGLSSQVPGLALQARVRMVSSQSARTAARLDR